MYDVNLYMPPVWFDWVNTARPMKPVAMDNRILVANSLTSQKIWSTFEMPSFQMELQRVTAC